MKKMHMIGNAHVDPVWLWRWQEGFQETKATFRSALDRLNEFEDFIFTSSSAAFYEWIEDNDPQMFEEIKRRIQEGRWVICGGWWIQPDCNIPSGESFVRQGLLGQRYFEEKFGVMAKVGYNVDSFGHNGMLPQILKKSGMDAYVFMRPGPDEKGLPSRLFLWESNDGSRVLSFRIPFEYATFSNTENHIQRVKEELPNSFNELMCFYGVGNHGGGPTIENIKTIQRMNEEETDIELILSSPNDFFDSVREKEHQLPVVHDDLQHHASGCYSVHSEVKKANREAENLLLKAEKFSSLALRLTGQAYPVNFNMAWKGILFNQFHDILAGTSIESAYRDARDLYGEANSIAARGLNYALQSMSWAIDIEQEEGMKPIVVFNPHSWPSKVNVEVEAGIFLNYTFPQVFIIEDFEGKEVPYQEVAADAKVPGRKRIAFIAELPPLGYATYKLRPVEPKQKWTSVQASDHVLENDRYRLEMDPTSGGIKSLFDKTKKIEILRGIAAVPTVIADHSDTWGHGKLRYDEKEDVFQPVKILKVEEGPVKSVIRVISEYQKSTVIQDFIMYKELNTIDVKVKVNWQEQFKALKLPFPVNLDHRKVTYEIPYGHIEREANGEEEPMQNWLDITGTHHECGKLYGLSLLNDGKYSADVNQNVMSLMVLRSPVYAHHAPYELVETEDYSFIDQGIQTFTYSLLPHEGSWKEACTVQRAHELNQRAEVIVETYHKGTLPLANSFISVKPNHVILSAVKKAEDSEDMIIRLYEAHHEAVDAEISLPLSGRKIKVHFGPSEIKTFKIPQDESKEIVETNLIEKDI